jgi:two-component SAPR family response regulator
LEIFLDQDRVPDTAWGDAKARELLLYLLSHPAGRTREQIGFALWPEASPALRKNAFHVALHHLREVLGRPEWIVFEEDRYRINPRFAVELDAHQFEIELRAARSVFMKTGDEAPLARALALYRGDFLQDTAASDWSRELRERWRQLYDDARVRPTKADPSLARVPRASAG